MHKLKGEAEEHAASACRHSEATEETDAPAGEDMWQPRIDTCSVDSEDSPITQCLYSRPFVGIIFAAPVGWRRRMQIR